MVLLRVFLTHEFSIFWIFEAVNGVLTEYGNNTGNRETERLYITPIYKDGVS